MRNNDNTSIDTRRLRCSIGWIGMLLPWLVCFITRSFPSSISITYYSYLATGTFMGILASSSLLLINYKGYDQIDDVISTITGIAGLCICAFPMAYERAGEYVKTGVLGLDSNISGIFHNISAVLFFILLSYMSIFLFTKSSGNPTKNKKIRNKIFIICGVGMLASFLIMLIPRNVLPNKIWVTEMIALTFFGISWLTKANCYKLLFCDKKEVLIMSIYKIDENNIPKVKCRNEAVKEKEYIDMVIPDYALPRIIYALHNNGVEDFAITLEDLDLHIRVEKEYLSKVVWKLKEEIDLGVYQIITSSKELLKRIDEKNYLTEREHREYLRVIEKDLVEYILFVDKDKNSVGVNCFPKNDESLEVNGQIIGGVVLCENTQDTANVKLIDSASNYKYLEIYFKYNDNTMNMGKVYEPNCKIYY